MEVHAFRAMTPGALNGAKPKNYGTGRRCACGTKIMQYRKGDRCGLCEDNDERHARRVEQALEADAMFGDKWKSKDYPDGCVDCPEGEKFKNRHGGRGRCSKHYQRLLKNEKKRIGESGPVDPRLDGRLELERATTTARTGNGTETVELDDATGQMVLDQHPEPLDYPANDEGAEQYRAAAEKFADSPLPGIDPAIVAGDHLVRGVLDEQAQPCCGDFPNCERPCVPRGKHLRDAELAAEAGCGDPNCCRTTIVNNYTPNPEGCPKDAHETCCFNPDDCNPDRDGTQPEPGEDISYSEYLMRQHSDALAEHFDTAARAEQAIGVFNELTALAREQAQGIQAITNQLHAEGIHVAIEPALLRGGYEPDAEVEAMERLRLALEGLDRDAQIRAVRWVTARLEIDRPLPAPAASDASDIL